MHDFTRNKGEEKTRRQQNSPVGIRVLVTWVRKPPQYRVPDGEGDCIGAVYRLRPPKNPKPQVTAGVAQSIPLDQVSMAIVLSPLSPCFKS